MEEYRASRQGAVTHPRRKGIVTFSFPERRVLIISETGKSEIARFLIKPFSEAGSKVCVIGDVEGCEGARCYPAGRDDRQSVVAAMKSLADTRSDIDIVITLGETPFVNEIIDGIALIKSQIPYPSSYRSRWIAAAGGDIAKRDRLRELQFTVYRVEIDETEPADIARSCIALCLLSGKNNLNMTIQ
ncbi:MAG: hypothetical protein NC097_01530 [Clostridium sp.]|nr:hypothetical protein [Clostridium sp.]